MHLLGAMHRQGDLADLAALAARGCALHHQTLRGESLQQEGAGRQLTRHGRDNEHPSCAGTPCAAWLLAPRSAPTAPHSAVETPTSQGESEAQDAGSACRGPGAESGRARSVPGPAPQATQDTLSPLAPGGTLSRCVRGPAPSAAFWGQTTVHLVRGAWLLTGFGTRAGPTSRLPPCQATVLSAKMTHVAPPSPVSPDQHGFSQWRQLLRARMWGALDRACVLEAGQPKQGGSAP